MSVSKGPIPGSVAAHAVSDTGGTLTYLSVLEPVSSVGLTWPQPDTMVSAQPS